MKDFVYATNRASAAEICTHLTACDAHFSPPLSDRVVLADYAEKLWAKAERFEAWNDRRLVGLVAMYCNDDDHKTAYISNVSVDPGLVRRSVARRLMQAAVEKAHMLGFAWLSLEVDERAQAAFALYSTMGFATIERTGRMITMGRIPKGRQE